MIVTSEKWGIPYSSVDFLLSIGDTLAALGTSYGFQRHSVVKQYIATQCLIKKKKEQNTESVKMSDTS